MRSVRIIAVLVAVFALSACNDEFEWNQKLTVVVQTPEGEVSGSSVTQVTKRISDGFFTFPEARGVFSGISGEAVVVKVTDGEYLFMLLDRVDGLAHHAFPQFPYERSSEFRRWAGTIEAFRGEGVVPPEQYPMMVTFEDIDDPTSVRLVEPEDIATVFGEGTSIQSVRLEITDEPTTSNGIIEMPFWSQLVKQVTFSGLDRFSPERPEPINYENFRSLRRE